MDIQKKYRTPDGLAIALIHTGGLRIIGKVPDGTKPGDVVTAKDCIELRAGLAVLPTPQGIVAQAQLLAVLVDGAAGFVDIPLVVHTIRYLDDMEGEESDKYVRAIQERMEGAQRARAERAGITLATDLPRGGPNGGIIPPTGRT